MWKPFVSPDCTSIRLFSEVWVLLLRCSSSTEGGNLRLSQRGSVWGRSIGISSGPLWMIRLSSVRSSIRVRDNNIPNVEKRCPLIRVTLSSYIFVFTYTRFFSLNGSYLRTSKALMVDTHVVNILFSCLFVTIYSRFLPVWVFVTISWLPV